MTFRQATRYAFTNQGGYIGAIAAIAQVGLGAFGMFGGSGTSGKMTTAQKAYLEQQQARQDQAFNFQQMLQPFLLDSMGLEATYGPNGVVTGIRKRALTTTEQQSKDIQTLAQEKVLKGLRGELDIDPATERALRRQDAQTKEYVARTGGQSGDQSTSGQTALNLQRESDDIIREQVRRGQMTTAESINATEGNQAFRQQQYAGGLMSGLPGNELNLVNQAQDYPGFMGRQNYLASLMGANRYAQFGNVIGGLGARVAPVIRGFLNPSSPQQSGSTGYPANTPYEYGYL